MNGTCVQFRNESTHAVHSKNSQNWSHQLPYIPFSRFFCAILSDQKELRLACVLFYLCGYYYYSYYCHFFAFFAVSTSRFDSIWCRFVYESDILRYKYIYDYADVWSFFVLLSVLLWLCKIILCPLRFIIRKRKQKKNIVTLVQQSLLSWHRIENIMQNTQAKTDELLWWNMSNGLLRERIYIYNRNIFCLIGMNLVNMFSTIKIAMLSKTNPKKKQCMATWRYECDFLYLIRFSSDRTSFSISFFVTCWFLLDIFFFSLEKL